MAQTSLHGIRVLSLLLVFLLLFRADAAGYYNVGMCWKGGIAVDSSGNIYATDYGNSCIVKYNSSGAFVGWIGKIATSPTGGAAGCNGAAVGTFTPGWCSGGGAQSGTGDGMLNGAYGLTMDSTGNLYVADSGNHRINRYSIQGR